MQTDTKTIIDKVLSGNAKDVEDELTMENIDYIMKWEIDPEKGMCFLKGLPLKIKSEYRKYIVKTATEAIGKMEREHFKRTGRTLYEELDIEHPA